MKLSRQSFLQSSVAAGIGFAISHAVTPAGQAEIKPTSGGYNKVWRETNLALARLSRDEHDRILGGTAIAFYRLKVREPLR
jgi:hypothetical protein